MSIRVIDMVAPLGLDYFLRAYGADFPISTAFEGHGFIRPYIECAPHYTGIRLKRTISGVVVNSSDSSWMDGAVEKFYTETVTSTYSYTKELSFDRVALLTGMSGPGLRKDLEPEFYWPEETYAEGTGTPLDPETECTMQLLLQTDEAEDIDGERERHSPIRQWLGISAQWFSALAWEVDAEVIGEAVSSVTGDTFPGYTLDDPVDLTAELRLYAPVFLGQYGVGYDPVTWGWPFGYPDGLHPEIDWADWQIDTTSWTESDWRDLRGVHTLSGVTPAGVTHTYEWEIY